MPLPINQLRPAATTSMLLDGEPVRFDFYIDRGVRVRCASKTPPLDKVLSWTELLAHAEGQGVLL